MLPSSLGGQSIAKYQDMNYYFGFSCTVTAFALMVIVTAIHGFIPSYNDEDRDRSTPTQQQPPQTSNPTVAADIDAKA